MEYNLEMVCSCVCRARQRTQRREWAAWAVKASETVMNREPAALPKGPVASQLQLIMPSRTVESDLLENWSFQEKGKKSELCEISYIARCGGTCLKSQLRQDC